jgi:hypothetical protein
MALRRRQPIDDQTQQQQHLAALAGSDDGQCDVIGSP